MDLSKISAGKNPPEDINVVIEIPVQGVPVKYELDKDSGALLVDRFMATSMYYPTNYGFIPQTLSDDGDPVDVMLVAPLPLQPGSVIRARPVGMLEMTDESGVDAKIIAVPHDKLTPALPRRQEGRGPAGLPARADPALLRAVQGARAGQVGRVQGLCRQGRGLQGDR